MKFAWHYDCPMGNLLIAEKKGNHSPALLKAKMNASITMKSKKPCHAKAKKADLMNTLMAREKISICPWLPQGTEFQKKYGGPYLRYPMGKPEATKILQSR